MTSSLSGMAEALFQQLQGAPVQQISAQLGTAPAQTQSAIATALPLLLGALGRNAQQPQGAEALLGALQRDHAGAASGFDLGGLLGSVLGGGAGPQTDGAGILGHIFGGSTPTAASGLGQATGLGGEKASQLLALLAPIVMSYLAQRFLGNGQGDASQLGQALGQEHAQVQQSGGLAGGLLGKVLDQDGNGQLDLGDLMKLGGGLFGGSR
ncbi:DUF937 domain-containing protein [Pseudoxanthomonas winnipegensis]|jgi:hypothetical protein|uniref:DUF937 domain-containing protein n=1 Tax=Pseudoxanthomonas winnipegensis TaxID=2480810 RepID=A0A4Q8LZH1_9GAMM|nr:DUF937 domain-containing protein [Pseudoxanthomonas winnipegensis]RZZ90731.1 DUF937 domain-containing protein [Pseudoxanthomonas winnipegensis]TAA11127.1 DUF937 domain-containing protein [Pseudoxanthomonas winnipegensis]TAA18552.1 DUF937 domain-containing protein [Pseudoxanthomonas winnipegensis]TAA37114.1 DUF937 domain-containing protein [Pseudoxanthomonas winnipegensis]TAH74072.1 DUF937 domain-containing protein [Pseudoxanthomonas winnipegensis]